MFGLTALELWSCCWEEWKALDKRKSQPSLAYSCLNLHLAKLSHIFSVHLSQRNQWKIIRKKNKAFVSCFPALPILLTIKLYSVSNHMHPNKGFKVWIETETVSAFGQQMQRKLAMFPLFARKAWKLGPLLCQRKREALIFLHTDFWKYRVLDKFLVWLVCLLLARCDPKPPRKDLSSTVNLYRLTWAFPSDYQFGDTFFPL